MELKEKGKVTPGEMQLADVVAMHPFGSFAASIVIAIDEVKKQVKLFRPYGTTADFSMVGPSVIPYIGIEEYWVRFDTPCEYRLLERRSHPLR